MKQKNVSEKETTKLALHCSVCECIHYDHTQPSPNAHESHLIAHYLAPFVLSLFISYSLRASDDPFNYRDDC